MDKKPFFTRLKDAIEKVIPMTLNSLVLFIVVLYMLFTVGRSVWINYYSNKDIDQQNTKVIALENEIAFMHNQIAYFKTNTYREKEAREKLGYVAAGEKALTLSPDEPQDKVADNSVQSDVQIKTPNYRLWWSYFTQS